MNLFALICFLTFCAYTVIGNSTFFEVPIIPYIVFGRNASSSVIVALQAVNSVPNLVTLHPSSSTPASSVPLTSYTSSLNAGLHMSAPLVSVDGQMVFAAVGYDGANPSLLAAPPAQYSIIMTSISSTSPSSPSPSPPVTIAASSSSDSDSLALGCALVDPNSSAILYIKGGSSLFLYDAATGASTLQLTVAGDLSGLQCSPTDPLLVAFSVLRGSSHRLVKT